MTEPSATLLHLTPAWGVAGLGNPLMGDDGCGPALIAMLGPFSNPPWRADLGTDMLGIQSLRPYPKRLLLVDAVHAGGPAGTLHIWDRTELDRIPAKEAASAHQMSPLESLMLLERVDAAFRYVDWRLVGLEAAPIQARQGLSRPMREALIRLFEELAEAEGWRRFFDLEDDRAPLCHLPPSPPARRFNAGRRP